MSPHIVKLADVGEGLAEAELVRWHVAVGDKVTEDQPFVDVMTDKATVEISAPVTGIVIKLHGEIGDKVAVGATLAELDTAGGGKSPAPAAKAVTPAPLPAKAHAPSAAPVKEPAKPAPPSHPLAASKPLASPAVRQKAWEQGIELQFVAGSGPGGRILHEDLTQTGKAARQSSGRSKREGVAEIKVLGLRRKIAERMQDTKRRIPHYSYIEEIDVTALEELRAHINAGNKGSQPKLTLLPFLIQALVKALPRFPQINTRFDDDAGIIRRYEGVHVGIATQTPDGLMVPVLRHAESCSLSEMATEILRLSGAARDGKIAREELSGSTITITSLGPLGGLASTPVINYPEVAIVGVNRIIERPVVRHGQIVVRKMMNLSSSFDHRVVDGWDAAEFIQAVRSLLEHPATLFVD